MENEMHLLEKDFRVLRLIFAIHGIDTPKYDKMNNSILFLNLDTLLTVLDEDSQYYGLINQEMDKLLTWWNDQLFHYTVELILGEDDDDQGVLEWK